jgi:predicted acetyltransferase
MVFLSGPKTRYRESFLAALREFHAEGAMLRWNYRSAERCFEHFLAELRRDFTDPEPGWVPMVHRWLIRREDQSFVGLGNIRLELTENLHRLGGHIGYAIRPSARRMGYGTEILRLMLPEAVKLGINPILITCDADNVGSRKIIERNGGIFENEMPYERNGESVKKRRYWITV